MYTVAVHFVCTLLVSHKGVARAGSGGSDEPPLPPDCGHELSAFR